MARQKKRPRPIWSPQWKCVQSRIDSNRLYYGRFILSPLMKGQADTIGITMRRTLLGEMEGTCITRAKFDKMQHEFSTIAGIQESIHEILMNLKEIVLRSNLYGTSDASICVRGPGYVTAQDIILPPSVEIIDNTQHIATLMEPIDLRIGLQIERKNCGYRITSPNNLQGDQDQRSYPIDAVFMPVRAANYSIHSYGNGKEKEKQEILFLEIWTNGSLTPEEALQEAARNLIDLVMPFLHQEAEEENLHLEKNQHKVTFYDTLAKLKKKSKYNKKKKYERNEALKYIFIDQFELTNNIYNCFKKYNIHTLWDLAYNTSEEDISKMMEGFRDEDYDIYKRFLEHLENQKLN
uniref:DNA-directed RNA polymerase n=1 Tax=Lophopyxis maingayi TaxID=125041 RepID=A0A7G8QDX7_9ROSI|nr:RNA polymerase alpha subunit [Lophopyxis maingayi]QNK04985.1 RNA polymerase alpha subunit [Lophopyxis maingayi]